MSDPTIFNGNTPAATPAAASSGAQDYATLLGMIVNDSGEQKYKSVEEALKGASHAQAYIAKLAAEKAALEAQVSSFSQRQSKEEELERTLQELLNKQGQVQTQATPATPQTAQYTPEQIAELVTKQLEQKSAGERAKANQTEVATKLMERFGAEAEAKYNAAAQELGMTVAEMNEFAAKSPKAVLKALGVDAVVARQPTFAPPASAVNTAAFQPNQDTFVKRNSEIAQIGATTQDLQNEAFRAKKMVEEVHAQGGSMATLADPKVYFKYFK